MTETIKTNDRQCPGTGERWWTGTGNPICGTCHRGPRGMGAKSPNRRRKGRPGWIGKVPPHDVPDYWKTVPAEPIRPWLGPPR